MKNLFRKLFASSRTRPKFTVGDIMFKSYENTFSEQRACRVKPRA